MEIKEEKLLHLKRAGFDLYIRNCGQIHAEICEFLKSQGYHNDNSYTRYVKAAINILYNDEEKK